MPDRAETAEDGLARRIEQLRTEAGWSYAELSRRMEDAGCPIERSSLQKIEKGNPRRKIGVDELIAFTVVFGKTFAELLVSPADMNRITFRRDLDNVRNVSLSKVRADREFEELTERLVDACLDERAGAENREKVAAMYAWAEETNGDDSLVSPLLHEVLRRVGERMGEE